MNMAINDKNINNKKKNAKTNFNVQGLCIFNYGDGSNRKDVCCTIILIVIGIINVLCSIFFLNYSIYEFLMKDRINMKSGTPAYELWKNPTPEVLVKIYIFNITNANAFLNGMDDKIIINDVGPVVYQEILEHSNIVFNNNSTLSYTATKRIIFREDLNKPGILNQIVTVPNLATLYDKCVQCVGGAGGVFTFFSKCVYGNGIASYLQNTGMIANIAAKIMMKSSNEPVLRQITIYDYLWNYTSDVLSTAKTIGGSWLVPVENMGIFYNIYRNYSDKLNVKIGPNYKPTEFFQLLSYNYRTTVPGFDLETGDCNATILGSTEGAIYPQFITKDTELLYWRKTLCRVVPLYYEKEVQKGPLLGYKFELLDSVYDRINDTENDCYKGPEDPLPNGLTDVSKCFYKFPVAASKPHFFGRNGSWLDKLVGLNPNRTLHDSYIILEPTLGTPIDQVARSQSNLIVGNIHKTYPDELKRFSNTIIPMFWIEIHQPALTLLLTVLVYFTVKILPLVEKCLGPIFILSSCVLFLIIFRRLYKTKLNQKP